jgi:hypothetical protein
MDESAELRALIANSVDYALHGFGLARADARSEISCGAKGIAEVSRSD